MREVQSVGCDYVAAFVSILFDLRLEILPRAVELIASRMIDVVDSLGVEIIDVGARVGESPRDVAIESNDHARRSCESNAGDIELPRHVYVHLVPHRWQCQVQMRITCEKR